MRNGRCSNFDQPCLNFQSKKIIAVPDVGDFTCPECGRELTAIGSSRRAIAPGLKLAAILLVVGILSAGAVSMTRSGPEENTAPGGIDDLTAAIQLADTIGSKIVYEGAAGRLDEAATARVGSADPYSGAAGKQVSRPASPVANGGDELVSRPLSLPMPIAPAEPARKPPVTAAAMASEPTTSPAAAPAIVESPLPVPAPVAPVVQPIRTLPQGAEVHVRPTRQYCMAELTRNGLMSFTLAQTVTLSDGSTLPIGTPIVGRVVAREASDVPDEMDRLRVALTSLAHAGENVGISSGQLALQMRREAATGKVVKYSIVGAAVGGIGAALLKQNPLVGVAIGGTGGAIAGTVAASRQDACMLPDQTLLPFRITRDAVFQ